METPLIQNTFSGSVNVWKENLDWNDTDNTDSTYSLSVKTHAIVELAGFPNLYDFHTAETSSKTFLLYFEFALFIHVVHKLWGPLGSKF